jgi:hypothetical protein
MNETAYTYFWAWYFPANITEFIYITADAYHSSCDGKSDLSEG